MSRYMRIASWLLVVVFVVPLLYAADTARLSGRVIDQAGAVVPAARVILTHEATGLQRSTSTSPTGEYLFLALPIGSYRLQVEATGFRKYVQTGIALQVNQSARNDVTMALGSLSQEITVQGDARMVDTDISEVKYTVDQSRIENIPLNGRNVLGLMSLMPGVISNGAGLVASGVPAGAGEGTYVFANGGRTRSNNYNLDGANMTDEHDIQSPNRYPPPDSIQEFTILTNMFKAEYGTGGAIINAVTKSGSNQIHGSTWEFARNNVLNAKNFFAGPSSNKYQYNQFGVAVGGPVIRNRTFLFVSYEGYRGRLGNSPSTSIVPTTAQRGGDLSSLSKSIIDPTTGKQFPGNVIPQDRLDQTAQNVLKNFVPVPNATLNQYIWAFPTHDTYDQGLFKIDHNFSEKSRFSIRGIQTSGGQLTSPVSLPHITLDQPRPNKNLTLSHTYVFSPTSLNEFRASVQRSDLIQNFTQDIPISPASLGFQFNQIPSLGLLPYTSVSNYFSTGYTRSTEKYLEAAKFIYGDSQSLIRGRHAIKIGGEYRRDHEGAWGAYNSNGSFTFNGNVTGNALADFLLGLPANFTQQNPLGWEDNNYSLVAYGQDDFKATRKLALNVGFRYEFSAMPKESQNQLLFYTPSNFATGVHSTVFPTLPPGMMVPGDPGMPDRMGYNRWGEWGELGPRFGFAYDVQGDGKTVIRSGFGIFMNPIDIQNMANSVYTAPFVELVNLQYPPSYATPFQGRVDPLLNWQPGTAYNLAPLFPATFYVDQLDYRNGYSEQWNFTIERELKSNLKVSASYVGMHGLHLADWQTFNQAVYVPGTDAKGNPLSTVQNENSRRPWAPYYSSGLLYWTNATRHSNEMQLMVQRRASKGLTLMAHYTLSNTMSWCDDQRLHCNIQNPNNLRADYSPAIYDVRHRGVASWVYSFPQFTANRRTGLLVSGWQISGAVTLQSGMPYNIVTGKDYSLTGVGNDRPDLVGDWKLPGGRTEGQKVAEYFNVNAFAYNKTGQFGNLGNNFLRGPGYVGDDVGLFKNFTVREAQHVEFRAEAFNLLNHVNFADPTSNMSSSTFGTIVSASNARIIQFALKYVF